MERYGIDEDRAFGFLVRASSTSNVKLREVAREVVDRTNQGRQRAAPRGPAPRRPTYLLRGEDTRSGAALPVDALART